MIRKLYIFAVVLAICIPASAQRHIWSKQGTVFDVFTADKEAQLPRAKRAYSPDRTKYLELSWSKSEGYAVPLFRSSQASTPSMFLSSLDGCRWKLSGLQTP